MSLRVSSISTVVTVVESNADIAVSFSPSTRIALAPVLPVRTELVFTKKDNSIFSPAGTVTVGSFAVYAAPLVESNMIRFSSLKGNFSELKSLLMMPLRYPFPVGFARNVETVVYSTMLDLSAGVPSVLLSPIRDLYS